MPTRILRDGILTSEKINALSFGAEMFYRRLMSVVDDHGRSEAHTEVLRARCYPLRLAEVTRGDIDRWLAECLAPAELVTVYQVGGKSFLQINNFCQRTRSESRHPAPSAVNDGQRPSMSVNVCQRPSSSDNDGHCPSLSASRASTPTPTPTPSPTPEEGGAGETLGYSVAFLATAEQSGISLHEADAELIAELVACAAAARISPARGATLLAKIVRAMPRSGVDNPEQYLLVAFANEVRKRMNVQGRGALRAVV